MKSRLIRYSPALAILALGVATSACNKPKLADAATPETAVVSKRNLEIRVEASGQIQPIRTVEVKSKASGEVLKLTVETGTEVKKGDLIADIDPRDVQNALAQAQADLEVARSKISTSEAQRKRSESLRKGGAVTEQEYEAAVLDAANSRAQLVKAQVNLQLARERMGDVTIRSPIAGTVIAKTVEVGQIIASASQTVSGGTTLVQMADLSEIQMRALVDETDIGRVQPGQNARVTVSAYPERTFVGSVEKIEPQAIVDQNVTMFPVLIHLDNREKLLKPGMNADVSVEIATRQDAITVPNAAVVSMRDAQSGALALGLTDEQMKVALAPGQGGPGGPGGGAGGAGGADAPATTTSTKASPAAAQKAVGAVASAEAAKQPSAECTALRDKVRAAGGFQAMSEDDRTKMRACREQSGGGNAPAGATNGGGANGGGNAAFTGGGGGFGGGAGGFGGGGGGFGGGRRRPAGVRPGIIFVSGAKGIEPRRVLLGMGDFDYTEVIRGVQPGEKVMLMSVVLMQAKQEQTQNQIRQRTGGGMFGGGGAAGGAGARPAGGAGGGGAGPR